MSPMLYSNALQYICVPQITDAWRSDEHMGQLQELCWSLVNVTSRDNSKIPGSGSLQAEKNHLGRAAYSRNEVSQWLEQKGEKKETHSPVSKMWIRTLQESTPRSTSPGNTPLLKTDCLHTSSSMLANQWDRAESLLAHIKKTPENKNHNPTRGDHISFLYFRMWHCSFNICKSPELDWNGKSGDLFVCPAVGSGF